MYHSWPADKMRFKFISLLDNVEHSREDDVEKIIGMRDNLSRYEYFQNIDVCAAEEASQKLHLAQWQIKLFEMVDGLAEVLFIIPDIGDNYTIVKDMMRFYGYYPVSKETRKVSDLNYIAIDFMPNIQSVFNEYIKIYKYAYHVCPSKYDHKIEKIGLVPKSKRESELFSYSNRIFLVMNVDFDDNEIPDTNLSQIERFANYLYGEKTHKTSNSFVNEKEYTIWRIDLKQALKQNIDFYFDYTEKFMNSLYTTVNIPSSLLTKMKTIDIKRK